MSCHSTIIRCGLCVCDKRGTHVRTCMLWLKLLRVVQQSEWSDGKDYGHFMGISTVTVAGQVALV